MQFYIISPLILVPLYYLFPLGLVIGSALLLAGMVISGTFVGIFDFQASLFAAFAYKYQPPPNVTAQYMDWIYVKTLGEIWSILGWSSARLRSLQRNQVPLC